MSSTNRSNIERITLDFYPTPAKAFAPMLPYVKQISGDSKLVWEPCSGDNRLIRQMVDYGIKSDGDDLMNGYDFFEDHTKRDIILTNPPFSCCTDIIQHSLGLSEHVFMLLRLSILESEERKAFWQSAPLKSIFVLSKRPSFVCSAKCKNKECEEPFAKLVQLEDKINLPKECPSCGGKIIKTSSDSAAYGWFYWGTYGFKPFNWI